MVGKRDKITRILLVVVAMFLAVSFGLFVVRGDGINGSDEKRTVDVLDEKKLKDQRETVAFGGQIIDRVVQLFYPEGPDVPPPSSMERMKKQGCIADGLLNGYGGDTKRAIKLINRSECYYLHRAVETWLEPPDFDDIKKNMGKIKKHDIVYGMFIAEAIDTKAKYYYPAEDRKFDFSKMCRPGSKNFWGEHTCKPSFERSEYRKYVRYITEKAMDLGIQSFMFGQIHYQDRFSAPVAPEIVREMREAAQFNGMEIVIGAQTNDIDDEKYLRLFDFIEGGVGLDEKGEVEAGPCFSRWWKQEGDWCWALLWNKRFSSKANNVFVHLDWSGRKGDDMSTFALMSQKTRHQTLENLHKKFLAQDIGFLMPMLAVLPKDNGGCHGKKRKFYSPDNKYSCKDEDVIKEILRGESK